MKHPLKLRSIYTTLLFAGMFLSSAVMAAPGPQPTGEAFIYKEADGEELKLWVTKPADWTDSDQRPAMVFFHGGGWVGGAPAFFNDHCNYFASRGMVTATVQYRLLKKGNSESPLTCVQDAKSAMRWMRSHAKVLGIDEKRIGAAGGSAGGHLAAFCGMVEGKDDPQDDVSISPKPNALVLFNPVFNNGPGQWGHARVGDHYREFSPAHNITRDDPPAIIFLGEKDDLIPVDVAKDFQTQMKSVGVTCELHTYEGQKHGFFNIKNSDGKYYFETVTAADQFLGQLGWLKGPPTLRKAGLTVPALPTKE